MARDGSAHTAGEPNDSASPVPNRRDAVQRSFNASTVVASEAADSARRSFQLRCCRLLSAEHLAVAVRSPNLGAASEVEDDLHELPALWVRPDQRPQPWRQHAEQAVQVVAHRHCAFVRAPVLGGAVQRGGNRAQPCGANRSRSVTPRERRRLPATAPEAGAARDARLHTAGTGEARAQKRHSQAGGSVAARFPASEVYLCSGTRRAEKRVCATLAFARDSKAQDGCVRVA